MERERQEKQGLVGMGQRPRTLFDISCSLDFLLSESGSHWSSISRRLSASSFTYFNRSTGDTMGRYGKRGMKLETSAMIQGQNMVPSNRIQEENKMPVVMIQGENMVSWIRERAVGVEESGWVLDIFGKQSRQCLLINWLWGMGERFAKDVSKIC